MTEEQYPEHEKLHKVKDESQTIGYFLEWFFTEYDIYPKNVVGEYMEEAEKFKEFAEALAGGEFDIAYPMRVLGGDRSFNEILARRYGIDYDELMAEKDRILEAFRERAAA
jgi:hypothetical protein